MKTFLKWLILVPLAILAIMFAYANRHDTTVSFDPFSSDAPAYALSGPLFIVIVLTLAAGVVIGGLATWMGQGHHRRSARSVRRDVDELRAENARLRTDLDIVVREAHEARALPALQDQSAA